MTGQLAMEENLRQLCLYRYLNSTNTAGSDYTPHYLWFSYASQFDNNCGVRNFTQACSYSVMASLGIPVDTIDQMVTSTGTAGHMAGENTLLYSQAQFKAQQDSKFGYQWQPALYINNDVFHGEVNCPLPIKVETCSVLQAICEGFKTGTSPSMCAVGTCILPMKLDACGVCLSSTDAGFNQSCASDKGQSGSQGGSASSGVNVAVVIAIVLASAAVLAFGVFMYMKRQQLRMRQDIDSLLHQYLPLERETALSTKKGYADQTKLLPTSEEPETTTAPEVPSAQDI